MLRKLRFAEGRMAKQIFFAAMIIAGMFVQRVEAQAPVVLRGIVPWNQNYDPAKPFFIFQDLVNKNEKLKGKVEVKYLGGPEITPPTQQFAALKNGVVDVIVGTAAYYVNDIPLSGAVLFTSKPPSELRKTGYYDLMRKIHADGGVVYLANAAAGNKFRMYVNKPIDKPDFTGLRIRVSPVYVPLVRALNGTPVSMVPGDVYTALERGVVDGFGWSLTGIELFGWQEVTKYVIDHSFYSLESSILINQNVWNKLPDDVKAELNEIGKQVEVQSEAFIAERLRNADAELASKHGVKFIKFSEADAKKFVSTAYDAGWADFLRRNKATLDSNPAILEQLRKLGN